MAHAAPLVIGQSTELAPDRAEQRRNTVINGGDQIDRRRGAQGAFGAARSARVGLAGVARPSGGTVRFGRLVPASPPAPTCCDHDGASQRPDDPARPEVKTISGQQAGQQATDERTREPGHDRHRPVDPAVRASEDQLRTCAHDMPNRTGSRVPACPEPSRARCPGSPIAPRPAGNVGTRGLHHHLRGDRSVRLSRHGRSGAGEQRPQPAHPSRRLVTATGPQLPAALRDASERGATVAADRTSGCLRGGSVVTPF